MTEKESKLQVPYIAMIPGPLQEDDTIPDSVKIYFGQLVALSNKYGYCWATDEQLSEMKNTSIWNIKRWNGLLEDAGYIRRETKNVPTTDKSGEFHWVKKRKIFTNNAFMNERPMKKVKEDKPPDPVEKEDNCSYFAPQEENSNNFTDSVKNDTTIEGVKNDTTIEGVKNDTYNSKPLKRNIKEESKTPPAVFFSSLSQLDMSDALRVKISKEHHEEDVNLAVARTLRWAKRSSDEAGLMATLKNADSWKDPVSPEQCIQSNLEFLKQYENFDGTNIGPTTIVIGNKYIEFISGMKNEIFTIDTTSFKKDVTEYFEFLNQRYKKGQDHVN